MQDISAMALLTQGEKLNTFLDIGCRDPKEGSNSLLLEQNGWQGLCVDIDDHCQAFEEKRKTPFFKVDSTGEEFISILLKHFPKRHIDYISLDVDEASLQTLENLLKNNFNCSFMTFEHDYHYVLSNARVLCHKKNASWDYQGTDRKKEHIESCKFKSKSLLEKKGYKLLFENVCFYEKTTNQWPHPWEDWWINPALFDHKYLTYLESVMSKNIHFKDCFNRISLVRSVDS